MDNLFIFKFGGSCLKSKGALADSLKIINKYRDKGKIITVTSAFYGVTDLLLNWKNNLLETRDELQAAENLEDIFQFHMDFVNELISNMELRTQSLEFLSICKEELECHIPNLIKGEDSLELTDKIISYGERLSTFIYCNYLKVNGFKTEYFSADDNLLITDNIFGKALPNLEKTRENIYKRLNPLLKKDSIPVFTGFYGCTKDGKTTTLGRGGTDFTATIIAYALAERYRITVIFWKDVYGLLSANPKYEPHAKILKHISFSEARELAFFGSKVLHPLCLITAEKGGVDVELRNFNDPFNEKSTIISKQIIEERSVIKSITALEKIAMITIEGEAMVSLPGAAAKLFSIIGNNNININFISQSSSENNITFGVTAEEGFKAGQILADSEDFGKRWLNVLVEHDVSLMAVVGMGMADTPGIAGKVFTALGDAGVNVRAIAQGSSEMNISFVIKRVDLQKAVRFLYHKFIETTDFTTSFW